MNEIKIEYLWKWFIANEPQILEAVENGSASDHLVESLDNLVLDMGMFTWEIGAGQTKPWFFTISPNGDKDLLKVSRKIIAHAPDLKNWEFNYCKPPLDWDYQFNIYDGNMDLQHIDAAKWKYTPIHAENGKIELIIEAENINHLDHETALSAAELVVASELGEEAKIHKIESVDIVDQLDPEYAAKKSDIQDLKAYLLSL